MFFSVLCLCEKCSHTSSMLRFFTLRQIPKIAPAIILQNIKGIICVVLLASALSLNCSHTLDMQLFYH